MALNKGTCENILLHPGYLFRERPSGGVIKPRVNNLIY